MIDNRRNMISRRRALLGMAALAVAPRPALSQDRAGPKLTELGAIPGQVSAEQAERNASILNTAITAASSRGYRTIVIDGLFRVRLSRERAVRSPHSPQYAVAAISLSVDRLALTGAGHTTGLKAFDDDASYGVVQFLRAPLENGVVKVKDSALRNMLIDGSYTGARSTHVHAVKVTGTQDCEIAGCFIRDAGHYLIGMQNGGHLRTRIIGNILDGCAGDGLDMKNNVDRTGVSHGRECVISHNVMRNFGRGSSRAYFAGIDAMGPGLLMEQNEIHITAQSGDSIGAGIRLKQGRDGDKAHRGNGAFGAKLRQNRVILEDGGRAYAGFDIRVPDVTLDTAGTRGAFARGIWIRQPGNITVPDIEGSDIGILVDRVHGGADSYEYPGGDNVTIQGGTISRFSSGVITARAGTRIVGVTFRQGSVAIRGRVEHPPVHERCLFENVSSEVKLASKRK